MFSVIAFLAAQWQRAPGTLTVNHVSPVLLRKKSLSDVSIVPHLILYP